ncbi:hypothetical protein Mapa_014916 [Marchantia paleacea]|nr:hypothetical protein Mapa_014916 [Marchantia paleacea]
MLSNESRVGAAECGHRFHSPVLLPVDLKVNQALGENEEVTFVQGLGEELVGGVDESHIEHTLNDVEKLRTSRMSVESIQSLRWILEHCEGHSQSLERREHLRIYRGDGGGSSFYDFYLS